MSGDVQPRKRKDKKKKRDGGGVGERKSEGELIFSRQSSHQDDESSHGVHITKMGADDIHLHVQHDHGTGGHWCAKIIFFFLMAILVGLVGLIIMENRDSTDMDTPLSESRFSTYFQGWVDEHRQNDHDNHNIIQHDDDNDHDADSDHVKGGEEKHADNEDEHGHEHEYDHDDNDENEDDEDDEDDEDNDEDAEIELENIIINDDDDYNEDDRNDNENNNVESRHNRKAYDVDNDGNEEDDDDADNGANNDNDNDNDNDNEDNQNDDNINGDDDDNDDDDDDDEDFDDDNDENFAQIIENDAGEIELLKERARRQQAAAEAAKNTYVEHGNDRKDEKYNRNNDGNHADDDDESNNAPYWANALLTKLGVGFALAFVARIVLLRKNITNTSDLTRCNKCVTEHNLTTSINETESDNISSLEVKKIFLQQQNQQDFLTLTAPAPAPALAPVLQHTNPAIIDVSEDEVEIIEEIEYIEGEEDKDYEDDKVENTKKENGTVEIIENLQDNKDIFKADTIKERYATYSMQNQDNSIEVKSLKEMANIMILPEEEDKVDILSEPKKELIVEDKLYFKNKNNEEELLDESKIDIIEYDEDDIYDEDDNGGNYDIDDDYDDDDDDDANDDLDDVEDEEECQDYEKDRDADDDISDIDDTDLMNRLEAKYGKLPVKDDSASDEGDDYSHLETFSKIKPKTQNAGPKTISSHDNEYDTFENELKRANEEMMPEFSYY